MLTSIPYPAAPQPWTNNMSARRKELHDLNCSNSYEKRNKSSSVRRAILTSSTFSSACLKSPRPSDTTGSSLLSNLDVIAALLLSNSSKERIKPHVCNLPGQSKSYLQDCLSIGCFWKSSQKTFYEMAMIENGLIR